MTRIQIVYFVFKEISLCLNKDKFPARYRLLIAEIMVRFAETYDAKSAPSESNTTLDYFTRDLTYALENPFEILERETEYMRLYENSEQ